MLDTNKVEVEYNGELWSFDSLWQAAETGGYFEKGLYKPSHDAEIVDETLKQDADGDVTLVLDANIIEGFEDGTFKPEETVTRAVERLFTARFRLGMFADDCEYDRNSCECNTF